MRMLAFLALTKAESVASVYGAGKVRPLSSNSKIYSARSAIDAAISRLNFDRLELYISSDVPQDSSINSSTNPAALFDVHAADAALCEDSADKVEGNSLKALYDRYHFSNGLWSWCSNYVISCVVKKYELNAEKLLIDFFQTVGDTTANISLGHLMSMLFEYYAPTYIS